MRAILDWCCNHAGGGHHGYWHGFREGIILGNVVGLPPAVAYVVLLSVFSK